MENITENKEKTYDEIIEEERNQIISQEKKAKKISTVTMIVIVGCAIGGVICMKTIQWLAYVFLGMSLLSLVASFIFTKRIQRPDVRGYIDRSNKAIDDFVYGKNDKITNINIDPKINIDLSEVITNGVYDGIVDVKSRNVVTGEYNNISFKTAELALFKERTRTKRQTLFVGKFYSADNSFHFEDRVVLMHKNLNGPIDPPTIISDLKILYEKDGFGIYGNDKFDYKKVLGKDIVSKFESLKLDDLLLNNILIIWAGKTYIFSSYDDKVVTLPFYDKINTHIYEKYKSDILQMLDLISLIGEKNA